MCVIVVATLAVSLVTTPVGAELHAGWGYLTIDGGAWDFSDSAHVTAGTSWDIGFVVTAVTSVAGSGKQGELLIANFAKGAGVQMAPSGIEFDSLLVAPDTSYMDYVAADQYRSYFVLTQEGHYAKVELQDFSGQVQFRYVYQDDGSTVLDESVATKAMTWGRLKSMYR